MMPILHAAGGDDAGAIRPDEPDGLALEPAAHAHHVHHGDAFGDADDEGAPCVGGFDDGVGRAGRRDEDERGVGAASRATASADRVEDGDLPLEFFAAAAGRHAGDDLRSVLEALLRVERAGPSGDPLHDDARFCVDQD